VAYLRDRNIPAEDVSRHFVSNIPMTYYSQRNNDNTQSHSAVATLAPEDRREVWLLINWAVDESLASSAGKLGIARYQILERVNFSGN
jgi:hypothetical protein